MRHFLTNFVKDSAFRLDLSMPELTPASYKISLRVCKDKHI